jgi:CrcB protein
VRERAGTAGSRQPIDPEADDPPAEQPGRRAQGVVLAVIAAGGAAGALARYGLSAAFPAAAGQADWATLGINAAGCAVIGVLMTILSGIPSAHPLIRPFAITGVLGGFTTFSTAIVDVQRSLEAGAPGTALGYLFGTLALALAATAAGLSAGGWLIRKLRPAPPVPVDVHGRLLDVKEPLDAGGCRDAW